MRTITLALVGLVLAGAAPAMAQAWLTVSSADGAFRLDMPVPFDLPPEETEPDGTVTFAYVHEKSDFVLRFEVVEATSGHSPTKVAQFVLASREVRGDRVEQTRVQLIGQHTYRLIAVSSPELEHDP